MSAYSLILDTILNADDDDFSWDMFVDDIERELEVRDEELDNLKYGIRQARI